MRLEAKLMIDYHVGGLLHIVLKPPTVLLGKLLRRNHNLDSCSTLTFLKVLGGGSLAIAFPALLALKQQGRRLRLVTTPAVKPFAEVLGVFDEILIIRDSSFIRLILDAFTTIRKRLFRCDAIIDLEVHSRLTTVFSLITCARNRIGFFTNVSFWRHNISTHLLFFNLSNPVYVFYDQIAELFGATVDDFPTCIRHFRASLGPGIASSEPGVKRVAIAPCCS